MKKTFLVMLMAGSSMAMFAQTTPTTTPTSPTKTTTSTNPSTTNGSVTNSTTDPMGNVTNPSLNNNTINATGNMVNNGSWNNGTPPSWTWTNYGIWDANTYTNGNINSNTDLNNSATNMNSTGYYSAYSPVNNVSLPWNVQMNYSKEYPTAYSGNSTWSQYGDWFYTTYMNNGRYSQIFYDQRGRGYSVALPVLNTYVPENVVNSAVQKYGSSLYSITMLKAADGKDVYQINLLDHGQSRMEWVGDDGTTAMNIYRTDDVNASTGMNGTTNNTISMTTTESNAAMDTQSIDAKKSKTKIIHEDGSKTKIKTKNGKTKVKEIPAPQDQNNQ